MIGVKVDPQVVVDGTVVAVAERKAFVSAEDRAKGIVGDVERHDVLISQGNGGQLQVRYRVRDELQVPVVGQYVAVEARVSEGTFRDDQGREREFVNLVAAGPAASRLDLIHSSLAVSAKA